MKLLKLHIRLFVNKITILHPNQTKSRFMKHPKILAATVIFVITCSLSAQSVSERRNFIQSFPAGRNTRLELDNKYGDIHLTSWGKDSVSIMAEIQAFAPSRDKLEKMFRGISVDMTGTSSLVIARTKFDQNLTEILESFKGLTDKVIEYNSRVKINYYINTPDYIDINLSNQLGDVTMESNSGTLSVTLSNGSFKANSLEKISEMKLSFANADIGSVRSARLQPSFSELVIGESSDLSINSTSSRFNLGKAGVVETESRRDKFFIDNISQLDGTSYFTDFKIEQLGKGGKLTLKYGSLDVAKVENLSGDLDIRSVNSDVTLSCDPSVSFSYEIRHTNSFVVLPDRNTKSEKETINEERKEYISTGTVGRDPGSRKITIDATRGNIYLR